MSSHKRKIVIIGGGFGGITAAKELKGADAEITVIDKANHHLFQPLLYQVATAALSPGDIATPIRALLGKDSGIKVVLGEVETIDTKSKSVHLLRGEKIPYDQLVLATGARYNYFGNEQWENHAPGLKSISDALQVRERILLSLEEAEQIADPDLRRPFLTYAIIGGGPTGVEMAGAIAEITKRSIEQDFSNINKSEARIFLIEAAPNILNGYPEPLPKKAQKMLEDLGVRVLLNTPVINMEKDRIFLPDGSIESPNIIWAAGVVANPLAQSLGGETDRSGRVMVNDDLSLPGNPDVFVIGDAAHFKGEKDNPLPAVASVAMQQGRFVGRLLRKNQSITTDRPAFRYTDKGTMATIGRAKAVADIRGFKISGFFAWVMWSFVHILYLASPRNRRRVFVEWIWSYFTFNKGVKLITDRSGCSHCHAPAKTPQWEDEKRTDIPVQAYELQLQD